jgi:C-terminal processing protease CtpA/Prc
LEIVKIMKIRLICVACFLFLALGEAHAAAPVPVSDDAARIQRLAGLCKVWGAIKYFHPDIVTKDIDWDTALVKTIDKVDAASNAEEYRNAVSYMLQFLGDPQTQVAPENRNGEVSSATAPQPLFRLTDDNIAIVSMTDYSQFVAADKLDELRKAFADAAQAKAVVLDLRHLAGTGSSIYYFLNAFNQTFPTLLEKDLPLASKRHRMYSGYPTQTGATFGGYYSAFVVQDSGVMEARGKSGFKEPIAIVINEGTLGLDNVLAGLQSAGLATVIREGEDNALNTNEDFSDGYQLSLPDDVTIAIRTTELLNPDGSAGFRPDQVVSAGHDAGLRVALAALSEGKTRPKPAAKGFSVPAQKFENPYSDMEYPVREYRLLALFRFWNVIEYFFPYKHLIDKPWDTILPEMIPEFEAAGNAQQYHLAVAKLVARIQDTHGFANSKVLAEYFGTSRPSLEVKSIEGKTVITHIFTGDGDASPAGIKVGDIILAVDGEEIGARRARIGQYVAYSTPQALRWRVDGVVLGGPKDSTIVLKVQNASGKISTVTLTRNSTRRKAQREGPVYTVLASGYGYIDLERLTVAEVDKAFNAIKNTPAVIFDLRGYPKGVYAQLGEHLAKTKVATARFEEPRPSTPDSSEVDRAEFLQYAQPGRERYRGEVVVLINEEAISQAEHTSLLLEAAAGAKFVGSATNGANGDVTQTVLPGGITVNFSGHDVRHADGTQLQRRGIQPDVKVEPTIAGIRAGRDEVLEKAVVYLESQGEATAAPKFSKSARGTAN